MKEAPRDACPPLRRAAFAAVLAAAGLSALALGRLWGSQRSWVEPLTRAQNAALLEALADTGREGLVPEADPFLLSALAGAALRHEGVVAVAYRDARGRLLAHRRTEGEVPGGVVMARRAVVLPDGRTAGAVEAHFSAAPARRALARARLALTQAALGSLGAAGLLLAWAGPLWLGPLRRQAERARHRLLEALRARLLLRRYLSPQAAREVLRQKGPLGGQDREVTVLLCDIRSFTSFSENLPPVAVFLFLNEFFSRLVAVIAAHGGIVNKYMGDAVLAVFGAPVALSDHASRASRCALEIRRAVRAYNRDRAEIGQPPVAVGIALHTGRALAGSIGTAQRAEYTVIGDTVNLVSRLEEFNKRLGTDIVISESTEAALHGGGAAADFSVKTLGEHEVRGRQGGVRVFELLEAGHG